jgi:hypothetical protein
MSLSVKPSAGWRKGTNWFAPRSVAWARAVAIALLIVVITIRIRPGQSYLFTLDAVFGPHAPPVQADFYAPVALVLNGLTHVLGGAMTGRLYLALALFLAAFAPMVVTRALPWYAQCAAGVLGALNPWVYDRLVEGQWGVVVAAAMLFFWLSAWLTIQSNPGRGAALRLMAAAIGAAAFSANFIGILAVLALVAVLATAPWRDRIRLRWTLGALIGTAVLLLYGAVPFFLGVAPGSYARVQTFGAADFSAFASVPDVRFGLFNLVGLYGHWTEALGDHPSPAGGTSWWILSTSVLAGGALVGAALCRERRWLLIPGALGLLISASTATGPGLALAIAVANHLPLIEAYREPGKWNALWMVASVILCAEGIAAVAVRARSRWRDLVAMVSALAIALAALLPAGYIQINELAASIAVADYPPDWYSAAAWMAGHIGAHEQVVVLPWHLYESFPFTNGRDVANPAPVFFPGRLVISQDPELPGAPAAPSLNGIGDAAVTPNLGCALANAIRGAGVRWALVESGPSDAADSAQALTQCGFTIAEGQSDSTVVLRDSQ